MCKHSFWLLRLLLIKLTYQKAHSKLSNHRDPLLQQESLAPFVKSQPGKTSGHSPSSSFTLCFSDRACIWLRSVVLRDREAQQRSSERASVHNSGCGRRVSRSACLFALRAVPRCVSMERSVCKNRLRAAAFTHNLKGRDQRNTDSLDLQASSCWLKRVQVKKLKFYLRCLVIVNATHRNSLMSGSGRHFTELWGFSSAEEGEDLASSICFSFCPRLVNHSTWNRSMIALSSCWSRVLRRRIILQIYSM